MQELECSRRLPARLRPLAARQDLVVTREQLTGLGISHHGVAARTTQGIWVALGPRVVLLHSGTTSAAQRRWVGVLHGDPDAVLIMSSAAEAGGLRGFEEQDVHIAVAHGRETADLDHPLIRVRVHQSRHHRADLVPLREPARQTLARCVLEMASVAASDNRSRALVAAVVQQRLLRPEHLDAFVASRRTLPRRRLLRETVGDVAGGAHSLPELDYSRALRATGLPAPTRQRKVRRRNGVWYLDNDFEEWGVTVEVNGMQHYELLASEADDVRRTALQVSGRIVVDVSSYAVRHRMPTVLLRTAEALVARGWSPGPRARRLLAEHARREGWTALAA